jgi:large subunit ribosomal protein L23
MATAKKTAKKAAKKTTKKVAPKAPVATTAASAQSLAWVLVSPRITEKATDVAGRNVIVFNVAPKANKVLVARAVQAIYKVTPLRVNIAPVKGKTVRSPRTGKLGFTSEGKKAYVYLKAGDTISAL